MSEERVIVSVSVGNTTTSAGIFVGGALVRTARVPSEELRDSWRLFGKAADDFRGRTTVAVVGSVVPGLTEAAMEVAAGEFDAPSREYRADVPVGLEVRTDVPDQVGQDRLASALAAFLRVKGAVVVVDLGTAITVDAVSADGAFLGGAILPGARLSAAVLAERAALLPRIELASAPAAPASSSVPARNTEDAMRAGLLRGAAGAVDRLVEETREALGAEAPVVGTGGEAALIGPLTKTVREIETALTLEGLVRAVELEAERARAGPSGGGE
jgi:type III pantothenate kinase